MNPLELSVEREVKNPQLIERYKALLDEWSEKIPFSKIKKLGSQTEFVAAIEHATFKTKVTTQLEKRSLKSHSTPYLGQKIPSDPIPKSKVDPWKLTVTPFADFAKHHQSQSLPETECVDDCWQCNASGKVTCRECSGTTQVDCQDCNGYGSNKCSDCDGSGHIRETKTVQREVRCSDCDGSGLSHNPLNPLNIGMGEPDACRGCGGRRTEIKDIEEEYFVPCRACASSGKITCRDCKGRGKVLCENCDRGQVTCGKCDGEKRLLSWVSVEIEEEPVSNEKQYASPLLPNFKKGSNPLSNLKGTIVFTQDEKKRIDQFGFRNEPASAVLSEQIGLCRESHTGVVIRQRIEIEACPVVEYRYRSEGKDFSIYLNPESKLIEDLDGPVQSLISNIDSLAEEALKDKRYEEAYRLVNRGLCMEEATEAEKSLRDQALLKLIRNWQIIVMTGWLGTALAWWFVNDLLNAQIIYWCLLGLIPLFFGVQLFVKDVGVRFAKPKDRIVPGMLFGSAAFLSAAGIGGGTKWTDWIGFAVLSICVGLIGLLRSHTRVLRTKLEAHFATFPNHQALEAYVVDLDPKTGFFKNVVRASAVLAVLMAVLPTLYLSSKVNIWALDRTKIQFSFQVEEKGSNTVNTGTGLTALFNGNIIQAGDKVPPGKGTLEVTDSQVMPFKREVDVPYGRVANLGPIILTPAHGQLTLSSDPPDAEFKLANASREWTGKLPSQMDLPTGDYQLITTRKGWELKSTISVLRGGSITNKTEFTYGSVSVTSAPPGLVLTTNGVEIGKTPLTLGELPPGDYAITITDGENELTKTLSVKPKEVTSHQFVFHYGGLQISSTPSGATVIRKGKEIGKTPLTLKHVAVESADVELRMADYVSSNFVSVVTEGETASYAIKLFSQRYASEMKHAQEALEEKQFPQALESVGKALESEPGNAEAAALKREIGLNMHCDTIRASISQNRFDEADRELSEMQQAFPDAKEVVSLKETINEAKTASLRKASQEKEEEFKQAIRKIEDFLSAGSSLEAVRGFLEVERTVGQDPNTLNLLSGLRKKIAPVLRDQRWQDAEQKFSDSSVSESYLWRYSNYLSLIREGTQKALDQGLGSWKIKSEERLDDRTIVLNLAPRGIGALGFPYAGVLMLWQDDSQAESKVEIRSKFWMYPPGSNNRAAREDAAKDSLHSFVKNLTVGLNRRLGQPENSQDLPR